MALVAHGAGAPVVIQLLGKARPYQVSLNPVTWATMLQKLDRSFLRKWRWSHMALVRLCASRSLCASASAVHELLMSRRRSRGSVVESQCMEEIRARLSVSNPQCVV